MSHADLYNSNGLVFWSEDEIAVRDMIVARMVSAVQHSLLSQNQAFKMVRCEAPILTPYGLVNPEYKEFFCDDPSDPRLAFRPETTMGSYAYAKHILSGYHDPKYKLPICVWQHGKSFRKEQDQPTKFMRLKEFYQLEFQVLFSASTSNDYYPRIVTDVQRSLAILLNVPPKFCYAVASDRLPKYSDETTDVVFGPEVTDAMEICSISRRKDYAADIKNIEIAIGIDRVMYNYMKKGEAI